jgi:hypothetical protein
MHGVNLVTLRVELKFPSKIVIEDKESNALSLSKRP